MYPTDLIATSLVAAVISNPRLPDNPVIECNEAFCKLTGYTRDEVVGRNCRFLSGPSTEPWLKEQLRSAIRRRQPMMVELTNYRKDGSAFRNAVMIAPIFDAAGDLEYFLGSQVEILDGAAHSESEQRRAVHDRIAGLTTRQRQILIQLADGKLNKQIAFDLDLSERTVKMHRAALFKALGVRSSAEAIRIAIKAGY